MLEACGIPYKTTAIELDKHTQKEPWFPEINPNGRIPAIIDNEADGFKVVESGAILIYLAEKVGRFLGHTPKERSQSL